MYTPSNNGTPGCVGISDFDLDKSGEAGGPGGAAGALTVNLNNVQVIGATVDESPVRAIGVLFEANGGPGGPGGSGGNAAFTTTVAGPGGAGGAGGPLNLNFSGSVDMHSLPAPGFGLYVSAVGGDGAPGGTVGGGGGGGGTLGGAGGAAGGGGAITATINGDFLVSAAAVNIDASGGGGGSGGPNIVSYLVKDIEGGAGGAGGAGGSASLDYVSGTVNGRTAGLVALAQGGMGNDGGAVNKVSDGLPGGSIGGSGGAGGGGGTSSVTLEAGATVSIDRSDLTPLSVVPFQSAVVAAANGGDGGAGQPSVATGSATAGSGGAGGTAGQAGATILGNIAFGGIFGETVGYGVQVLANGGQGGAGGNASAIAGTGGGGGLAGAGGTASLALGSATQAGVVTSNAYNANAALVQSVGGGGGGGGSGYFNVTGGTGAAGGNGGAANANLINGQLIANASASSALIIQSIGGGGGVGGDETGIDIGVQVAIGGNGGLGGNGGPVNLDIGTNAVVASLSPIGDFGVLAQSIGGSGGAGGSASSTGVAILSLTVGGDAGMGAPSGNVLIHNDGIVTTYGSFGAGIQAQSIGGGGGDGGAGVASIISGFPTVAVALGGRGGGGGVGHDVTIYNTDNGQITTYGSDAYGIVAQSIGGGGGTGGLAASRAVSLVADPDIPAVSVAFALGGKGGIGNNAGNAEISNTGLVSTAGEGAVAIFSQSVGGGGGAGGDSTALAYSGGKNDEGIAVSAAVSIGGGGAGGGDGALATIANSGLVITLGTDAAGMVAQSVGGGGGRGGAGDSSATANDPEEGFTVGVNLAVGGSGGIGGKGGGVILINSGSVITGGDGADGFFAQSVGGGGGSAGGGVANAGGNQLTLAVAVGGSGGAGGDGGGVTAQNSGAIVTRGVDAMGILAQSVGGGGGEAGKGGATSGGVDNVSKSTVLYNTIAGGLNVGADVTQVVDGVFKFGSYLEMTKTVDELTEVLGISKPTDNTAGVVGNLDLSLAVGGSGGAAGNGGEVDLTNSGGILTTGAQSDAIYAQSVGGGGGKGGEATSTGQSYDDTRNQISIGVAGGGGNAGNGGTVKVVNAASSEITTRGVLAFGILGQSIGGGGGTGAQGQAINGSLRSLAIAFNGFDGAQGTGGLVTIENDGSIVTQGKNGIGIFGQSIGGGGGVVETMTSDMTFNPDDLINNPQGRAGDIQGFSATFGGGTNSQGDGGQVQITNAGSISTMLRDAHGILAESIGGGGGATIGGQLIAGLQGGALPANTNNGNGGAVTVNLNSGSSIATQGDGAYGVLAHSIGGGGGLSGDLSNVTSASTTLSGGVILPGTGNGGNVTVNLTGAKITTSGTFAPGVLAQSVGGGGGILAQNGQLQVGASPNGNGRGGDLVSVNLVNSTINTTGMESPAIVVQNSYGLTPNGSSVVNIDANSAVTGGGRTPEPDPGFMYGAIVMLNNKGNWINNSGVITGVGTPVGGGGTFPSVAINSAGETQINNSGTITGTILTNGLSNLVNSASGLLHSREIALYGGQLSNAGTLMVDDFGVAIVGSLVNTGTIEYTRLYGGPSPGQLYVEGNVNLAGNIFISKAERISVGTSSFTAIASSGTITGLPSVSSDSAVLRFKPQLVGSSELVINVTPDFAAGQTGLSASRSSLATYLDAAYAKGDQGLATGLQTLIANATPASALANLNALSADGVISIASVRYEASQSFTRAIYGCPTFGEGTQRQEHDCAWFRIDGVWSEHDPEGGFAGYRWQAVTLKGGGQREIAPNLFLGGSLGYEGGVLEDKDNLTRVRSDSGLAAVALLYQHGPWTLISAADAGVGWFDSRRLISIANNGEARGDSAAWNIGGHLRAAYRFAGPRLYLEPSLGVDLTYVSLASFSEHGSTSFNLALDHADNVVVSGTPEVRIGTRVGVGDGAALDIYVGGGASFLSGNSFDARARFVVASPDIGSFTTSVQNDDVVGRVTAGVQLFSAKRWDLQLQYEGRLSANETEHGVQGRLAYRF